jgi:hypothetical protein
MFDEIIFDKTFYSKVTFRIKSLTGSRIYVKGRGFAFDFDRDNEEQMKLIANVLLSFCEAIDDDLKTSEDDDKLRDFDLLVNILNRYKGE